MIELLVATEHGLTRVTAGDGWQPNGRVLADRRVTTVASRGGTTLVGTTTGIVRSAGGDWREASSGLSIRHIRWLAFHPGVSGLVLAGTEPAGIFVSGDNGETWRGCPEVEALRDAHHWFLPYSPEAGCVRGFAFHGDRIYAAVEVGGVLRSDDVGQFWRLAGGSNGEPVFDIPPAPQVHADVHSIEGHSSSPDLVFAVTAEGMYRSEDAGDTWAVSHAGSYCRALWVDPADADHLVLGPADTVRTNYKNGRIEESRDGGRSWQHVSEGLDLPWPDTMVERFAPVGDDLIAITNSGTVYAAPLSTLHWQRILQDVTGVAAVAIASGVSS